MSDHAHTTDKRLSRLKRYGVLARAMLYYETYAATLAPAFLAAAIFAIGALAGIWERIGDPWRLIALLIALAVIVRSVYRALPLRRPTRSDALRRIERDSGQNHRPLDTLEDAPAISREVWPAHYKKAYAQAERIERPRRRHALSPIDPYYLRFAAPFALALVMIYAAGFGFERLRSAVTPQWQSGINPNKVSFEAWIDPPEYTGRPPIYFKYGTDIVVPVGSEFVARLSGASNPPRPKLWQSSGAKFLPLTPLGAKSVEARAEINSSGKVEWRIGTRREVWTLNTKIDTPPEVDFIDPPKADKRDRLVFTYQLLDDYGVETLQIEMAEIRDGIEGDAAFEGATRYADVPLSSGSVKQAENASAALDLTKHEWAGRKVIARLKATDGAGFSATSEPVYFTVPDKIFVEPLAKAVVEQRQLVLLAKDEPYAPRPRMRYEDWRAMGWFNTYQPKLRMDRAPAKVQRAALLIDAVTDAPDQMFKDPAVYMGLRNVHARLRYADDASDLNGIPEDLWKIALRAEFGVLGTALEEMREAEEALREGMARRAVQREIDTLFERYNLAVEAYTEELRRKAMEEGNFAEGGGGGGAGGMGSVDEIKELMKAIEEANKAGDTEGARRALARLAELLENMEIQLAKGGGGGDGEGMEGEMSEEMKKSLEDLADMMGDQRDLQDETRQAERDAGNGEDPSLSPQELAERQAELESLLEKLAEALPEDLTQGGQNGDGKEQSGSGGDGKPETGSGEGDQAGQEGQEPGAGTQAGGTEGGGSVEDRLDAARRAMRESENGLSAGRLGEAGDAQARVMRELREAGQLLADAAAQEDGEGSGEGDGESTDPLGRAEGGFAGENSEVDIDTRDNATRSRELLEELRRRAAEQEREKQERDYLERLLKRF
ncbi:DUF4175 domain-containing protein [Litorimonas sp. RW-G-Af-16]|uniref:DUF4175 domain-containing protein n=1 Tax=Litorimonas sp. RW-G-Af-16 TaxID=3241168 RepID=UPI00390CA04E